MVDLLKQAKNIIAGKGPDFEAQDSPDNRIDRVDQCKVIWYQWSNELNTNSKVAFGLGAVSSALAGFSVPSSELAKSRSYDISNHIESVSYSKPMNTGAGTFQIILENTFDWARYLRPGSWITVYMTGDGDLPMPNENGETSTLGLAGLDELTGAAKLLRQGVSALSQAVGGPLTPVPELPLPKGPSPDEIQTYAKKRRIVGIISRVGIKSIPTQDGSIDVVYSVTGKDFGMIYDETDLWFNASNAEARTFESVVSSKTSTGQRNITELLKIWHNIFLNPNKALGTPKISPTSAFFPEQWVLPDKLVDDLGLELDEDGDGFFGDISNLTEFNATLFENQDPNPLAGLEGFAWGRLKSLSQPEFHELFTELSDNGNPKLYFRPIPWAFDKSQYPVLGKAILSFKDLTSESDIPALLPIGTNTSILQTLSNVATGLLKGGSDERTKHSVSAVSEEIETFDIGPDFHNRYNFFLVDSNKSAQTQGNAFALVAKSAKAPFPFRDENDIKRHGFKPLEIKINTFFNSNQSVLFGKSNAVYSNDPNKEFILQANQLLRDYYANAEDLYSGTMIISGKPEVKLGKVLLTPDDVTAIPNMAFYIEGYTDIFSVNGDGVGTWIQTLNLTRGIRMAAIDGGSTKDRDPTKTGTFHTFNKGTSKTSDSILGKIQKKFK